MWEGVRIALNASVTPLGRERQMVRERAARHHLLLAADVWSPAMPPMRHTLELPTGGGYEIELTKVRELKISLSHRPLSKVSGLQTVPVSKVLDSKVPVTPQPHPNHTPATPQPHPNHTPTTPQPHPNHTPITPQSHPISLSQVSSAAPYNMGIGYQLTAPSRLTFRGIAFSRPSAIGSLFGSPVSSFFSPAMTPGMSLLRGSPRRPKRIEFIGASDTAGYCANGEEHLGADPFRWRQGSCMQSFSYLLARRFDAEVAIEALAGSGLLQPAKMAQTPHFEFGKVPMPSFYERALLTHPGSAWNFSSWVPELVVISLGGNDYNHQHGHVPSNASFSEGYAKLVSRISRVYRANPALTILAICGMGSPVEVDFDADNNRCRPCPYVEMAVEAYRAAHAKPALHYLLVPCDGSVVTGHGDLGCDGHKNSLGMRRVADYMEPHLRRIMHPIWRE